METLHRSTQPPKQELKTDLHTHEEKSARESHIKSIQKCGAAVLTTIALWNGTLEAAHYTDLDSKALHAYLDYNNAYPGNDTPGLNEQTSRAASALLGTEVAVNCYSPDQFMESPLAHESRATGNAVPTGFVPEAQVSRLPLVSVKSHPIMDTMINLDESICESVIDFEAHGTHGTARRETKHRMQGLDKRNIGELFMQDDKDHPATRNTVAANVLAHEYSHIALNSENEALVQCSAIDLTPGVVKRSQVPPDEGELQAMQNLVFEVTNNLSGDYRSTDCYRGGPYDVRAQGYKNLPVGNDAPSWLPEQYEIASWGGGDSGEPETVYYVSELDSDDLSDVK